MRVPLACLLLVAASDIPYADDLQRILQIGEARSQENAAAQQQVHHLADVAHQALTNYGQKLRELEQVNSYNRLLQAQVDAQSMDIHNFSASLKDAAALERRLLPLLLHRVDSLEHFVSSDMPFRKAEREAHVQSLYALLERPDKTIADKFREVLAGYQREEEYGRTLESYQQDFVLSGRERVVDILRIGRIALLYLTKDEKQCGAWDSQTGQWRALENELYLRSIRQGLGIARHQVAPELLIVPIPAAMKEPG